MKYECSKLVQKPIRITAVDVSTSAPTCTKPMLGAVLFVKRIYKLKMIRLKNRLNNVDEVSTLSQLQDVNTDIILTLCGEKLGSGFYRSVYEFNMNPNKMVVKVEPKSTDCNIAEFLLWDEIQGLKGNLAWVKEWFAPIHWCSPNGKVLIMERTKQLDKERPKKVPYFFTDVKADNFGWIGNKFVCHDYGFIHKFVKYEKKYQNAVW